MRRFACLFFLMTVAWCRKLGRYRIDQNRMSVSGLSSGAAMAHQFHIAYSSIFRGAAPFAGLPYWCAKASSLNVVGCMDGSDFNIDDSVNKINELAGEGKIDPLSNLSADRDFIWHGTLDSVIANRVGSQIADLYGRIGGNVQRNLDMQSEHGMPTENNGVPCNEIGGNYINRCQYFGAYEAMNYIHGDLIKPDSATPEVGELYLFEQGDFFLGSLPIQWSMDSEGYAYVPPRCSSGQTCGLHIAFHGCNQGKTFVGDAYVKQTNYNQVADANNFIILYPQAMGTLANPMGCWDWWGYTNPVGFPDSTYVTKDAAQMLATKRMIDHASSGTFEGQNKL